MTKFLLPLALATALAACAFAAIKLRAAEGEGRFDAVKKRVVPRLKRELAAKGLELGAPVFMRVFKEEGVLELWLEQAPGVRYALFRTYKICAFSGELGPKLEEGDRQAPEGFYFVARGRMNPRSTYHLSFDLGYPNAYDRQHGRTGSYLMVHGNCVSVGCYAMTDKFIEEIYTLADAALAGGQKFFRVHCFPFKMDEGRMGKVEPDHRWRGFWENLRTGYRWFEREGRPPEVTARDGKYHFSGD